jgi:hypothetical protein
LALDEPAYLAVNLVVRRLFPGQRISAMVVIIAAADCCELLDLVSDFLACDRDIVPVADAIQKGIPRFL